MFSKTTEVADMVMTGRHRRVPVVRGHLGGALYRSRTIFGAETIEVRDADASAFGGILSLQERNCVVPHPHPHSPFDRPPAFRLKHPPTCMPLRIRPVFLSSPAR